MLIQIVTQTEFEFTIETYRNMTLQCVIARYCTDRVSPVAIFFRHWMRRCSEQLVALTQLQRNDEPHSFTATAKARPAGFPNSVLDVLDGKKVWNFHTAKTKQHENHFWMESKTWDVIHFCWLFAESLGNGTYIILWYNWSFLYFDFAAFGITNSFSLLLNGPLPKNKHLRSFWY